MKKILQKSLHEEKDNRYQRVSEIKKAIEELEFDSGEHLKSSFDNSTEIQKQIEPSSIRSKFPHW